VLVIDLDPCDGAVAVVADAVEAGWSVLVVSGDRDRSRAAAAIAAGERDDWLALDRSARADAEAQAALLDRLTNRELAVLDQLERGRKAVEIAAGAIVAISTVRTQIRSILLKLEVNSQERAVALYREVLRTRAG
jgi:two-component system nitrate/nitrite response regulator NarL